MAIRCHMTANVEWHPGLNFSVHRGDKWIKDRQLGQTITISPLGIVAKIEVLHVCKLKDVPAFVYKDMHSIKSASVEGLFDELIRAYPGLKSYPVDQLLEEQVVCVGYRVPEGLDKYIM